jgi:hypothetical protein
MTLARLLASSLLLVQSDYLSESCCFTSIAPATLCMFLIAGFGLLRLRRNQN